MNSIKKVAIQGVSGAFHEIASRKYFKNHQLEIIQCLTFNDLFDALLFEKAEYGVIAIENSLVGSIIPNYALLRESKLKVLGEVFLRIEQHLMVYKGEKLEDIKEIYSHPMAIEQCIEFLNPLRRSGVRILNSEDTALSAKRIADDSLKGVAAIASDLAAEKYGLEIINKSIETNKKNFTRFLVISSEKNYLLHNKIIEKNKASLCFRLPDEEGILSQVLSVLAFYKINLLKIQSLPVVGVEWEYLFYIDLIFSDYEKYNQALNAIRPLTKKLTVLGEYQKGERPKENKTI
ncbi:MAG: prephenate dehydratase [Bacteroidales bacterium]|jgi:prephenate dehydratase|nr:prephenate dehydratase [Bacteroidales bacterium]